jgi:phosphoribosylamine-glycine ligase
MRRRKQIPLRLLTRSLTERVEAPLMPASHFEGKNVWLLKPAGLNRGRGIHIFNTLAEFDEIIRNYKKVGKKRTFHNQLKFVVQKYIENPLLINNRKFDIRVWVLLTPELDVYYFT